MQKLTLCFRLSELIKLRLVSFPLIKKKKKKITSASDSITPLGKNCNMVVFWVTFFFFFFFFFWGGGGGQGEKGTLVFILKFDHLSQKLSRIYSLAGSVDCTVNYSKCMDTDFPNHCVLFQFGRISKVANMMHSSLSLAVFFSPSVC